MISTIVSSVMPYGHFLNVPAMGSLRHLINGFGEALDLYIYRIPLAVSGVLDLPMGIFSSFHRSLRLGLWMIFEVLLGSVPWLGSWSQLKMAFGYQSSRVGECRQNIVRNVSQV